MRKVEPAQLEIGGAFIEDVEICPKSRDDIPALLLGMQHLYAAVELRKRLFALLDSEINPDVRKDTGRPGMDLWSILVLAILKQGLGCDWDRLCELANHHQVLRQMMGHGWVGPEYEMQTVIDNVSLLSPSLLAKVNELLVGAGHKVAGKKPGEPLRGRCDSFCAETDVHYPTSWNLLWDAMRCTVRHAAQLAGSLKLGGWRQHRHVAHGMIKRAFNRVRTAKLAKRSPERVEAYVAVCEQVLARARETLQEAERLPKSASQEAEMARLRYFMEHAGRQIDQIRRRVLQGETIPHEEKVFSIFEPHTRWVAKGKAGTPQELGVPVCVIEDQHRFILHHRIMWQGHDVDHAAGMVSEAQKSFPELRACSFDRGFHSPRNQRRLAVLLDEPALPVKGHLNAEAAGRQSTPWFQAARKQHPAVESAINHLEHCGLDRVRSHGADGFARSVSLSVLAANVKRLGRLLREQERRRLQRRRRLRAA